MKLEKNISVLNNRPIAIKDSCIIFDLIDLNLIDEFFCLKLVVITTPMVIDEIKDPTQLELILKSLENQNFTIDLNGDDDEIFEIYHKNEGLSFTDSSVLELAKRKNGVLLSSDKGLRNEAKRQKIAFRGILWIIRELVNTKIITSITACEKLQLYCQMNQRAPRGEVEKLIKKLKKTDKQYKLK